MPSCRRISRKPVLMNKLEEIVAHKRREIAERSTVEPRESLIQGAEDRSCPPDFLGALRGRHMGIIAEVKRRSPSAGEIRESFDPAAIVSAYHAAGVSAVSVLMDKTYFGGGEDDFRVVRGVVNLPLLYKEFVIDPWQVSHAQSLGASAVLLLAGVLDVAQLVSLRTEIGVAGMVALIEVHDAEQMRMAVDAGADCIGVNNRNLSDFSVSLETSLQLVELAPKNCTLVSESGVRSPTDVERVFEAGYHAVLVGEHLLRQDDPGRAASELMQTVWNSS